MARLLLVLGMALSAQAAAVNKCLNNNCGRGITRQGIPNPTILGDCASFLGVGLVQTATATVTTAGTTTTQTLTATTTTTSTVTLNQKDAALLPNYATKACQTSQYSSVCTCLVASFQVTALPTSVTTTTTISTTTSSTTSTAIATVTTVPAEFYVRISGLGDGIYLNTYGLLSYPAYFEHFPLTFSLDNQGHLIEVSPDASQYAYRDPQNSWGFLFGDKQTIIDSGGEKMFITCRIIDNTLLDCTNEDTPILQSCQGVIFITAKPRGGCIPITLSIVTAEVAIHITRTQSGWKRDSCLSEGYYPGGSGRALTGDQFTSPDMTVELCTDYCHQKGFPWAGVEFGKECYCGEFLEGLSHPVKDRDCDMICLGNSRQFCGGRDMMDLYFYAVD